MEMFIRAIQAQCQVEACRSKEPEYVGYMPTGAYFKNLIWNWWMSVSYEN